MNMDNRGSTGIFEGKVSIQADLRNELNHCRKKEKYCSALNDMVKELRGTLADTREERYLEAEK